MTTTTDRVAPTATVRNAGPNDRPTIAVTSDGDTTTAELEAAARQAWPLPGRLELLSTDEVNLEEYVSVFAPLVTEPCS